MFLKTKAGAGLFGWLLFATAPSAAQVVRAVPEAPSCRGCRIELEPVITLTDTEPHWFGRMFSATSDSRGRLHGSDWGVDPGVVHVLGADGAWLASYGRQGRGPGEGIGVTAPFFGPGDTAFVYDLRLSRFTIWSPRFELVRSFRVSGQVIDAVVQRAEAMTLSARLAEAPGLPLHVIDTRDGSIIRSFGPRQPPDAPPQRASRRLAASRMSGSFWAARLTEYVIERWDTSGRLLLQLKRTVSWFPPNVEPRGDGPPSPAITAIWEDERGPIWVMIVVADQNWQRNHDRLRRMQTGPEVLIQPADQHGLGDTVLEVIDPATGALLASRRLDPAFFSRAGGLLFRYTEGVHGTPSYELFRPRLTGYEPH
ncbi:hypothetical protein BH23GEM9_BH23GEM9_18590 [soil metagenome]